MPHSFVRLPAPSLSLSHTRSMFNEATGIDIFGDFIVCYTHAQRTHADDDTVVRDAIAKIAVLNGTHSPTHTQAHKPTHASYYYQTFPSTSRQNHKWTHIASALRQIQFVNNGQKKK